MIGYNQILFEDGEFDGLTWLRRLSLISGIHGLAMLSVQPCAMKIVLLSPEKLGLCLIKNK